MRHVKLKPGVAGDDEALRALILEAYSDVKERVENG
jgi:DNA-binding protein YbaB